MKQVEVVFSGNSLYLSMLAASLQQNEQLRQQPFGILPEKWEKQWPKWLKTTDIQLAFTEDHKPVYSFETIQPLSEVTGKSPLCFWQGRYAHRGDGTTTNSG